MTVAPGHFHAALVQKHAIPGVHPLVHVYAPLDDDLNSHLRRIISFNTRSQQPTAWQLDVRAGDNYLHRFLREQPGNTVVLSGRNKPKIDLMLAAVENGLNVLADKPWVIDAADFPKLERVLREAELREVVVWDMMTERFEVTNAIQRELVNAADVFGGWRPSTPAEPALTLESVHHLKKQVAGKMLRRPPWWFDVTQAGDGLADVGTHLADLAMLMVAPGQAVRHENDVRVLDANRWPLLVDRGAFAAVTREEDFPEYLRPWADGDTLRYFGNGSATVAVRGVHVRLTTLWELEADAGWGDRHEIVARGNRATVTVTHDPAFGAERNVLVKAADPADHDGVFAAVQAWCQQARTDYPGLAAINLGDTVHLHVPDRLRLSHENLFAVVVQDYIRYFHNPRAVPSWEWPNLLAKYHVTTAAVQMARKKTGGA